MKLHTPEGAEMMEVTSVVREGDQLVVRGVIMGTMPTRAVVYPVNLRAAFGLLSFRLVWDIVCLLFSRKPGGGRLPSSAGGN